MRIPINVVFQGGGAKLVTLVGAVRAIRASKDLDIRGVAGTSAGSIAAAMLAFKFDLDEAIDRVRNAGPLISALSKKPGWPRLVYKAWYGKPIIDEVAMRSLLEAILSDEGMLKRDGQSREVTEISLDDADVPLRILTTDFANAGLHVFRGRAQPRQDAKLVDSLMHSCAIPIAVRTFAHLEFAQNYIDGGVCDNLPSKDIFDNTYPTIGFSFRRDKAKPANQWTFRTYCQNLLSVAMNRSVDRTIDALGAANVCRLPNEVDWLDFSGAASFLCDPKKMKNSESEATQWLQQWVHTHEERRGRIVQVDHSAVHEQLAKALEVAYKADAPFDRLVCEEMISSLTAESLVPGRQNDDDESVVYSKFLVDGSPVSWFSLWDKSYKGSPLDSEGTLKILDKDDQEVSPQKFIVLEDDGTEGIARTIYLHFIPPLTREKSPYRLTHTVYQRASMNKAFTESKCDFSSLSPGNYRTIQSAVVMVHCPKVVNPSEQDLFEHESFPDEQDDLIPTALCSEVETEGCRNAISLKLHKKYRSFARRAAREIKRGEAIGMVIRVNT